MPGFLLPEFQARTLLRLTRLSCFRRPQATNFLGISQQRPVNLKAIVRLYQLPVRIRHQPTKNPDRTRRQIQLRKLGSDTRRHHRSTNRYPFLYRDSTQYLAIDAGIHHFYLNQRLSSAFCLARWQKASTKVLAA